MDPTTQRLSHTLWVGVGLVIVIVCVAFVLARLSPTKGQGAKLPVLGQVADFALTNQSGQPVTLADLRGKVWLADIIFTRCAGPCPRMTRHLAALQAALPKDSDTRLITLTTDPEFDTPEVLQKYAQHFNAQTDRWHFLTGSKSQIAGLAVDGLKLSALERKPEERSDAADLFIHSTYFVLVDRAARLRAVFEAGGEEEEWTNVQPRILAAIKQLERER